MSAAREVFGHLPGGEPVERIRLSGADGFEVAILTYGASVQAILAPDADGRLADVVLGHDDLAGYLAARNFFGATIGRYANRIAGGRFELDGKAVAVEPNNGLNALHGGAQGFDIRLWEVAEASGDALTLRRTSLAGEEGFPGTLEVQVRYAVSGTTLSITLEATSDAPTVVNLTNHSFFNLSGKGSILDHELWIDAERFLSVDGGGIPLGDPAQVEGTPFDFRQPQVIGARIRDGHPQIVAMGGYDHNWCLAGGRRDEAREIATLFDPASGRSLTLSGTEPGLQFYSGNFLNGRTLGKGSATYRQGDGLCLEPQAFPDSPNRVDFPATVLAPGQTYTHRIEMRFGHERPARPAVAPAE